jgi:hypothetical protein
MPVIFATWEAEIRRIVVQGQPMQTVLETPSLKISRAKWTGGVSSGRATALEVRSLELKQKQENLQYHKK